MQSHSCFTHRPNVAQCPVQKYLMSYNRYKLKKSVAQYLEKIML